MDLSLPKINTEIPDFLLGDMWTHPEKLKLSLSVCGRQTPWGIAHLKSSGHT